MVPFLSLLLMLSFILLPTVSATTLIDSYPTGNRDAEYNLVETHPSAGAGDSAAGQSFQNGAYPAHITQAAFYLSDGATNPDGNVRAVLYAHTGTYGVSSKPTGAALATSDPIACNMIGGAYAIHTFTFSAGQQYVMAANTYYCIAIQRDATADGVFVGRDSSAPTHAGISFYYDNSAWTTLAGTDTIFYVYSSIFGSGDGTYKFFFDDAVYENNTSASSVTVTAVLPSIAEDFPVDGPTWYYATDLPTYFTWEVSPGIYRRIHVSASENFTITLPESTFTSFGFTLKDFTGETNTGTLYFETLRMIGGLEHVIERIPVLQTINLITATLVTNRNYVVQLTVGSTIYRYTFFSSPADTTPTIVLNDISFERQIQLSSKYVCVDADRPTPTSLRVNYTNSRTDTNSVQVRIRHMNGTLVNSTTIVSDSFTYTYNPVDNETAYYFDLIINTDTFGRLTWKKTLPWQPNFSNVPDPFTQLGTIGGLNVSRLFGFVLILFTALLFSAKDVSIACFSIAITTSLMSYWGFFPVPLPILAVVVGLTVLIGLGLRGR